MIDRSDKSSYSRLKMGRNVRVSLPMTSGLILMVPFGNESAIAIARHRSSKLGGWNLNLTTCTCAVVLSICSPAVCSCSQMMGINLHPQGGWTSTHSTFSPRAKAAADIRGTTFEKGDPHGRKTFLC